ncbi:hypothetical protein MASR2M8_08280 [Opitutaceae bacterium]
MRAWVDQFNTSGLGANTPINTGNGSEGLLALKGGKGTHSKVMKFQIRPDPLAR